MKVEVNFNDFADMAKKKNSVAVSAIVQVDQFTPIAIFEKLYTHFGNGLLAEITHENVHHICMSFNPRGFFKVKNGEYETFLDGKSYSLNGDVLKALRKFKEMAKVEVITNSPGLAGGMAGLISYEAVRFFEEKLKKSDVTYEVPDFLFYCYKVNLAFDLAKHVLTMSIITDARSDLKQSYEESINLLHNLLKIIEAPLSSQSEALQNNNGHYSDAISVDISDCEHYLRVQKAKNYIQKGDIFQVTLSRSFSHAYQGSPFSIYRTLRLIAPAPYLFYLDNGEKIIVGASPEKLLSVKNNRVETVPIAGTCKNLGQESIDKLLNDEKELAEHMMLVDLARNDLGKVCAPGSVKVEKLLEPKKAGNLIHLTTLVNGKLEDSFDAFDALKAVFPAGTVSGAPKVRAMEIIEELETEPRGFYGGAFCLIDNLENFDSAIVIRTIILKANVKSATSDRIPVPNEYIATVRAGSGIVFDSVPEKEIEETRAKAVSVLREQ